MKTLYKSSKQLTAILIIFTTINIQAQISVQSSQITIELKTVNLNDVAINGVSKEAEVIIDPMQNMSTLTLIPTTINSDNVDFNNAIKQAEFEPFVMVMRIDPLELNYSSKKNEPLYAQCTATINGITEKIPITMTTVSKMTNETHNYMVTGQGKISLAKFELKDKLPLLKDDIQFRFTQNIVAEFR